MNRLCIYTTYSKDKRLPPYVCHALRGLKTCCAAVYLVCSCDAQGGEPEEAPPCVERMFCRENRGYDFGAYRDMLCGLLGWEEVYRYDELVLVNDSFFGFFYPLRDTFALMDREDCDFWGITGQPAGRLWGSAYRFDAYVHSYFLVFRKNVIRSGAFRHFWERHTYPADFRGAVTEFEIGLNACLEKHGFRGRALTDGYGIAPAEDEVSFNTMPCALIRDYHVPVLKKKSLLIRNTGFAEALKAVAYIERENGYPAVWMTQYLERQFYIPGMGDGPCNSLEQFCRNHTDIYIYGAGVCGRNLALYFAYKGWEHRGFLCTENREKAPDVTEADRVVFSCKTGIVVSVLSPAAAGEIVEYLRGRCRREQLFCIADCAAIRLPGSSGGCRREKENDKG